MEKFNELKSLMAAAEADAQKFYEKGNLQAGTRLRKHMQAVKNLAQEVRTGVSEIKNDLKA